MLLGNCSKVMQGFDSDSVDLIVTDPPYGYSFMGKDWDKAVPKVAVWRECLRVLKAGGFAFVMSSPRADVLSQMIVRIGEAGFRTDFTPIYWAYASGFPKAMNIGKAVDKKFGVKQQVVGVAKGMGKQNPEWNGTAQGRTENSFKSEYEQTKATSQEAKLLDGSYGGFQPKPAVEVIIVAMKPLSEKTFVDQALSNGKGVSWLDNARIPFEENGDVASNPVLRQAKGLVRKQTNDDNSSSYRVRQEDSEFLVNQGGRFPANLLVSDDCLNDGNITISNGGSGDATKNSLDRTDIGYGYKRTETASGLGGYGDSGSFSRYFSLDAWFTKQFKKLPVNVQRTFPFLIEPKASKSERNKNLERLTDKEKYSDFGLAVRMENGQQTNNRSNSEAKKTKNFHPTVKPLQLMSYLITLGSRTGDLVLDPFAGSGTTCLAAKMLGRRFLGIELNKEYLQIAEVRVGSHKTLSEFFTPEIATVNPLKMESQ